MTLDSDRFIKLGDILLIIDGMILHKRKIIDDANDQMARNEIVDEKLYDTWAKAMGAIMALSGLRKLIMEMEEINFEDA